MTSINLKDNKTFSFLLAYRWMCGKPLILWSYYFLGGSKGQLIWLPFYYLAMESLLRLTSQKGDIFFFLVMACIFHVLTLTTKICVSIIPFWCWTYLPKLSHRVYFLIFESYTVIQLNNLTSLDWLSLPRVIKLLVYVRTQISP